MADANELNAGGAYVQKVREDTNRILVSLKTQNERLRSLVIALETDRTRLQSERMRLQEQLMNVREELSQRTEEHTSLLRRLTEVEHENESVAWRFIDIETQNTNLANLYVAGYQLHGSLDREQVLGAIREIIVNLIGSEEFAIYERVSEEMMELIGWFEDPPPTARQVRLGAGVIGQVAATGVAYFSPGTHCSAVDISACIPLTVDGQVTGAIAVLRLLPQKQNVLQPVDEELLSLLASQAGIALHCTRLHQELAFSGYGTGV